MKRDFAGAHVPEPDYVFLRDSNRDAFPPTYEAWTALVKEGTDLAAQMGYPTDPINVDVGEFLGWCRCTAIHPCLDAMRAFLIIKRWGLNGALGGSHRKAS